MTKQHINITVDSELVLQVKEYNINMSQLVNETLQNVLAVEKRDVNALSIRKLEREIKTLTAKLLTTQTQLRKKKSVHDMLVKKKTEDLVKQEKKEIEQLKNTKCCAKCGNIITNHKEKTEIGDKFICKSCYMTHDPQEMREWINEK